MSLPNNPSLLRTHIARPRNDRTARLNQEREREREEFFSPLQPRSFFPISEVGSGFPTTIRISFRTRHVSRPLTFATFSLPKKDYENLQARRTERSRIIVAVSSSRRIISAAILRGSERTRVRENYEPTGTGNARCVATRSPSTRSLSRHDLRTKRSRESVVRRARTSLVLQQLRLARSFGC